MRFRLLVLSLTCLSYVTISQAQTDTVELDEVVIEGLSFEKFATGSKIRKSDSLQLISLGQGTLSDYMRQNTTVYIREQGNKMLASVSFRGTGASHTGVFWHGINLNSLSLGTSDFNGYPLFLFDNIAVQYGGASSIHGSDAIGGSIHLGSTPHWIKGSKFHIRQDVGSFGNVFSGIKVNIGNSKWESKTSIFNRILKNNFTYGIKDRLGDPYEIEQENAEVHNYGLIQEFNRKIAHNGYLSMKGWYGKNDHQIQPLMVTSPDQVQTGDEIKDENLRLIGEYEHYFDNSILSSSVAYVWDYQLFNQSDVIETKRLIGNISDEISISNATILRAGANTQYIVPNVWSYAESLTEWRSDIFVSIDQSFNENWHINANVRKTFVPFTSSPIAPSLSASYVINKPLTDLTFRARAERSYRVPTFNDRYWGDQGRMDLSSENGYSMEIGHNIKQRFRQSSIEFDVSGYYMIVDDWIAWKPAGNLWRPFNQKKVEATGIELNGNYTMSMHEWMLEIGGMYAYNRSILREGITDDDPAVGYQLPYTPRHRAILFANIIYKKYRFSINDNYTGQRYGIDVINEEVDHYLLTDIGLSKNFSIGKHQISVEGQLLNVFDVEYQNVNRYAMPGRNYVLSINFLINNNDE